MMVSDALCQLQIQEKSNIHDVILLNFLQHELVGENIYDYYFQMSRHLYACVVTSCIKSRLQY